MHVRLCGIITIAPAFRSSECSHWGDIFMAARFMFWLINFRITPGQVALLGVGLILAGGIGTLSLFRYVWLNNV